MPQLDLAAYIGREQAYIKHFLLEKYLAPLVYKVGTAWDSFVYVDGFAGPWEVKNPELSDSSFGVAIETMRRTHLGLFERGKNLPMQAILVEASRQAFLRLNTYAVAKTAPSLGITALHGEFVDRIPEINRTIQRKCKNPFRFVFLDPKGWADIPMQRLEPFLKDRSCEVLINLMTRHIIRFLDQDDRASSYQQLFGRPGVLEKLRQVPQEHNERAEQAVREYCGSLETLCRFKYVSSAVILDPNKESVRYFLVYATNNPRGVEVFKQAEMATSRTQEEIRREASIQKSGGQTSLFDQLEGQPKSAFMTSLFEKYRQRARTKVFKLLRASAGAEGVSYDDLFCKAMAYPLVTPEDLQGWITDWAPYVQVSLEGSGNRRKPSPSKGDWVRVVKREGPFLGSGV